jgi:hemolysin D
MAGASCSVGDRADSGPGGQHHVSAAPASVQGPLPDAQAQQALVEQQRQLVVLGNQRDEAVAQKLALVQKSKEAQNSYEKTVFDDLTKAQAQISELRAGKIKAQQQLSGKTLRAPIDGTVQELSVHTVGGVVTPAQTLMLAAANKNRAECVELSGE